MDQKQPTPRQGRSREEMYTLMARYAAGGETQAKFYVAEGLPLGTFQYWWRRYKRENEADAAGFVALEPEGVDLAERGVELDCGPVRLQLTGGGCGPRGRVGAKAGGAHAGPGRFSPVEIVFLYGVRGTDSI